MFLHPQRIYVSERSWVAWNHHRPSVFFFGPGEDGDFLHKKKRDEFHVKNGDFTSNHGEFTSKNNDFTSKKLCFDQQKWMNIQQPGFH